MLATHNAPLALPVARPGHPSYDESMKRITISVPDSAVAKAKNAVRAGDVPNVSAYFAMLAEKEPDWAMFRAVLDEWDAEFGPPSAEAVAWARAALDLPPLEEES